MQPATTPNSSNLRGYLYLGFLAFVFFEAGLYASQRANTSALSSPSSWLPLARKSSPDAIHPITTLMADAESNFRQKLARQSRTLADAVAEYRRRHKRAPPKGFEGWWTFAQEHGVLLVDEYDAIVEDLEPFWIFSGEEFRSRVREASRYPTMDLVRIRGGKATAVSIQNGVETTDTGGRSAGFMAMLHAFADKLPDMDIPISARLEPRILVPWEERHNSSNVYTNDGDAHIPDWQENESVWSAYRLACPPHSGARGLFASLRSAFVGQPSAALLRATEALMPNSLWSRPDTTFVRAPSSTRDFCSTPHARFEHGHFFSDWRTMHRLLPVLSPAKPRGYSDIRTPSHYYYWPSRKQTYGMDPVNLVVDEIDRREVPWERKADNVFWRGPSTGGGSHPAGHQHRYQRHRFVQMAGQNTTANRTIVYASLDTKGPSFLSAEVPVSSLNAEIMDVAFTRSTFEGNYPDGETGLRRDYRFADAASLGEHWEHKYLFDLDGNAYSAKFFALMESESAVMKSTVFQEFWSDWAQPWLHYIPVSDGFHEIYNIYSYFSGPPKAALGAANVTVPTGSPATPHDGDARLRRIARAGKQWRRTMGRNVDMEAYVYRLMLEYARLWSDDREKMGYQP